MVDSNSNLPVKKSLNKLPIIVSVHKAMSNVTPNDVFTKVTTSGV